MPKKLLIADDSITIQKVMTITFPSKEYELVIVGNGEDAIKKSKEVKPDLVIADIGMPGKNGYEVCDAIKKTPELKNVPVLLLAGAFEPFDTNKAKSVGADDYIVKPFETQSLINKVNELLARTSPKTEGPGEPVEAELEESLKAELSEVVEAETAEAVKAEAVEEAPVEAVEVEEEEESKAVSAESAVTEEKSPEDLWSMEGFEGVEESREQAKAEVEEAVEVSEVVEEAPAHEEVTEQQEGAVPLAEEVVGEPSAEEEAIPLEEEMEEGITLEEMGEAEPAEEQEVPEEGIPVEEVVQEPVEEAELVQEAEPVAEQVSEPAVVKETIPREQISLEIEKQVSEVLSRLLPRLVEKITEEVIGSIAKGFIKEAIEKSNIHEVTRKMIEEELKKKS